MYDMVNIFETFLPQLLRYPNPSDPLNGEAAALLMRDPKAYDGKVKGPPRLTFARYRVLILCRSVDRLCSEICYKASGG